MQIYSFSTILFSRWSHDIPQIFNEYGIQNSMHANFSEKLTFPALDTHVGTKWMMPISSIFLIFRKIS